MMRLSHVDKAKAFFLANISSLLSTVNNTEFSYLTSQEINLSVMGNHYLKRSVLLLTTCLDSRIL
jgi:hypothetical protein